MPENQTDVDALLFVPFRFRVSFSHQFAPDPIGREQSADRFDLVQCRGEFSEIGGLEMSTTPKTIKEGGRNWGEVQLSTPVSFPNLVLKRGITRDTELWRWIQFIYRTGVYAYRADCIIEIKETEPGAKGADRMRMRWVARNCLPVKFKGSDLSATASSIAIEELHLAHEGLELGWVENPAPSTGVDGTGADGAGIPGGSADGT